MTTRDRILNEALTLFAENGYDGTSVEEIAEKVGIKAPSLYNHFKGKEDILNALIDMAEARYEEFFGSDKHFGKLPESKEEFIQTSIQKISFTMSDDPQNAQIPCARAIQERTLCGDHHKASAQRNPRNVHQDHRRYDERGFVQKG